TPVSFLFRASRSTMRHHLSLTRRSSDLRRSVGNGSAYVPSTFTSCVRSRVLRPTANRARLGFTKLPLGPSAPLEPQHGKSLSKRSEEHTSELQSPDHIVCRLLLEKKNQD